jgi:hypothetical protein
MFCRDNGEAIPLKRAELVEGSDSELSGQVKKLCSQYGASTAQVMSLCKGLVGSTLFNSITTGKGAITDPEMRVLAVVFEEWTKSPLWVYINPAERNQSEVMKRKKLEPTKFAYSSIVTLCCIGRVARSNQVDLALLRQELRLLSEKSQWQKRNVRSLFNLQSAHGSTILYNFMKSEILLPAYQGK